MNSKTWINMYLLFVSELISTLTFIKASLDDDGSDKKTINSAHYINNIRRVANILKPKLAAVSQALKCLPEQLWGRNIYVITRGLSAVQALIQPKQQSGQKDIKGM